MTSWRRRDQFDGGPRSEDTQTHTQKNKQKRNENAIFGLPNRSLSFYIQKVVLQREVSITSFQVKLGARGYEQFNVNDIMSRNRKVTHEQTNNPVGIWRDPSSVSYETR